MYAYFIANYSPFKPSRISPELTGSSTPKPGALRRVWRSISLNWQRQRTISALRELDDHVLRDIGLHRAEIPLIVKRAQADDLPESDGTAPRELPA
ncbi:DUF1127 domain-containing protein [Sulfitobacter sp. PS-8MA]|uniref:DUF1127 domain-containing protein n=1 Tax=Sulfitobacter sp. PS-8MA TaxID=3237707 RepID=UPI0034C5EE42